MYPKRKTQWLINRFSPLFIKKLRLNSRKLRIHVVRKADYPEPDGTSGIYGKTICSADRTNIYIFFEQMNTPKQVIGTLVHELLHEKFYRLERRHRRKYFHVEEHFIQSVENLLVDAMYSNILMLYLK